MAKRKNANRGNDVAEPESPIALLKTDHDKVEELFSKYEATGDSKTQARQHIVEEACAEIEIHAQLEEEIFYPALKAVGDKEGKTLVAESIEEHQVVKNLIEEIRELDPSDEQYAAKFTVLMENVRHHIEEEENEMFPLAQEELADEMEHLLEEMLERKQELQTS